MKKLTTINLILLLLVVCITTFSLCACHRSDNEVGKNVNISYVAMQGGTIFGDATQSVKCGESGTEVTAVADIGYEFVKWSDGKTELKRVETDVKEDVTLTAEFKRKEYTVEYKSQTGGSILGMFAQTVKHGESGTEVTAVADIGYEFVRWSDGLTVAERAETDVKGNKTLTAEFREKVYTINYTVQEGGSISGVSSQYVRYGESGTQVVAVPNEGYEFVKWSDEDTETTRMETNVTENKSFTAIFKKKTFVVEYIAQEGGRIDGKRMQTVQYGGIGIVVFAVAYPGYEFVKWSDGETYYNHIIMHVKDNVTITAEFRKRTYTLQYDTKGNGTIQGDTNQTVEFGESGTAVTAIPDENYEFDRWSDGVRTATRTDVDVSYSQQIKAIFKKKTFIVRYETNNTSLGLIKDLDSGYKSGFFDFKVEYGEDAPNVLTYSLQNEKKEDFEFFYWSDGVTTRERHETNITSNMTFTAYYGYKIDYIVNGNVGGKIIVKSTQQVMPGEIGEEVRAVADNGYVFMGWSDLSWEMTRQDDPDNELKYSVPHYYNRNLEIIAYFAPIQKTFNYDYCYELGAPFATSQITLNRNSIEEVKFAVPVREGYVFCGWYADNNYRTRITTATGRYMYGYAAFSLETDTLYARWEKESERTDNHKILMVFVDKVQTTLYSKKLEKDIDIDTTMTALDYQLCDSTSTILNNLLNEWFEGEVIFEVDAYYTTRTITEGFEGFDGGRDYMLDTYNINEVCDVMYLYHNTITVAGIDDYYRNLTVASGLASIKDAYVTKDHEWSLIRYSNIRLQDYIEERNNGGIALEQTIVETCLHELIHTAEMYFPRKDHLDLHNAIGYAMSIYRISNIMNTLKPCLLGEFEMNGEMFCVPMKYWKHDMDIEIGYVCAPINGKKVGEIHLIGDSIGDDVASDPLWIYGGSLTIPYGADCSVEAVPKDGYKFVRWSDGVTTAIRHDKNIIAHYCVQAIFEKI